MEIHILGSGTSNGIPVVGCSCSVCSSADPKDKRLRASVYIEGDNGETAVIDTGPEFRIQALEAGIKKLDAVFVTHAHADHIHGLDDVRPLSYETPIPVYCGKQVIDELRERFSYVFKNTQKGGGKPKIIPTEIYAPVQIGSLLFTPVPVYHGNLEILGFRVENHQPRMRGIKLKTCVYLTDTSFIPETSLPLLEGAEILIINGLRIRSHETHFNFEEALNTAVKLKAKNVYLTHICHDFSHQEIIEFCENFKNKLNINSIIMEPAYDGLVLKI
jgi:phosphoribosyl 1,2-cyclic phosphate phosphodiesterase